MFKRNVFLVCISLVMVFSFAITAFAKEHVSVEVNEDFNYAYSNSVAVTNKDLVTWSVTNTSFTQDLYYSLNPLPSGWCGTILPIKKGTVKPGETVTGVEFGSEITNFINGGCKLVLHGETGYGTLDTQEITSSSTVHIDQTTDPQLASSNFLELTETGVLAFSVTNTSSSSNLQFSITPLPSGWCGTFPAITRGTIKPGETLRNFMVNLPPNSYKLTLAGASGKAELHLAN